MTLWLSSAIVDVNFKCFAKKRSESQANLAPIFTVQLLARLNKNFWCLLFAWPHYPQLKFSATIGQKIFRDWMKYQIFIYNFDKDCIKKFDLVEPFCKGQRESCCCNWGGDKYSVFRCVLFVINLVEKRWFKTSFQCTKKQKFRNTNF